MKQIYIDTKAKSQNPQSINDTLTGDYGFIQKLKPNSSTVSNHPYCGGAGGRLCKGPPGRMCSPVMAYCLNPGNLEAPLSELVEESINTTMNNNYFIKNNNQLFTNN